jgi:hypothetical protein
LLIILLWAALLLHHCITILSHRNIVYLFAGFLFFYYLSNKSFDKIQDFSKEGKLRKVEASYFSEVLETGRNSCTVYSATMPEHIVYACRLKHFGYITSYENESNIIDQLIKHQIHYIFSDSALTENFKDRLHPLSEDKYGWWVYVFNN